VAFLVFFLSTEVTVCPLKDFDKQQLLHGSMLSAYF